MRVIEVKSCRECPYRIRDRYTDKRWCGHSGKWWRPINMSMPLPKIRKGTKTFPGFCPLKEAK